MFTLLFSTLAYKGKGDVLLGIILFSTLAYKGKTDVLLRTILFSTLAYKGKGEVHFADLYNTLSNIFFQLIFYWVTSLKNFDKGKKVSS